MWVHPDFDIEQRGTNGLAEERRVTRIVGMSDQTNTGWDQLRTRGFDDDVAIRTVE